MLRERPRVETRVREEVLVSTSPVSFHRKCAHGARYFVSSNILLRFRACKCSGDNSFLR